MMVKYNLHKHSSSIGSLTFNVQKFNLFTKKNILFQFFVEIPENAA